MRRPGPPPGRLSFRSPPGPVESGPDGFGLPDSRGMATGVARAGRVRQERAHGFRCRQPAKILDQAGMGALTGPRPIPSRLPPTCKPSHAEPARREGGAPGRLRPPRGAMPRGTVTETVMGIPIEGAAVAVLPARSGGEGDSIVRHDLTRSGPDGMIRIAAVPRLGTRSSAPRETTQSSGRPAGPDPRRHPALAAGPRVGRRLPRRRVRWPFPPALAEPPGADSCLPRGFRPPPWHRDRDVRRVRRCQAGRGPVPAARLPINPTGTPWRMTR